MESKNKNIEINSQNLVNKKLLELSKEAESNSHLLKNLDKIEQTQYFKSEKIKKWELLFNEWEKDDNLYIIKRWNISIEKYTTSEKNSTKQLSIISTWNFLWESSIDNTINPEKQVLAKAITDSEILSIKWEFVKKFVKEFPELWYDLLQHIIIETNKRLLESNKLITSSYEIEKTINDIQKINHKNIFWLIDKIKNITWVDYILYLEKNTALPDFLILKYDSRQPKKMQDNIFEKKWYFIDLDALMKECDIKKEDHLVINKLSLWTEVFGFLIFWKYSKPFDWSDKKMFSSVSNSLAWVLKKFFTDKEIKDIQSLKIY